jgi:hypothetical protein
MKKLTELLAEAEQENTILLFEIDNQKIEELFGIIEESKWISTGEKDYMMRVDPARPPSEKRHITISHQKHIHNKNKQVSWNDDGFRKDRKTFDDSFIGIEKAKRIARKVLNIPDNVQLEAYNFTDNVDLLLENADDPIKLTYSLIEIG